MLSCLRFAFEMLSQMLEIFGGSFSLSMHTAILRSGKSQASSGIFLFATFNTSVFASVYGPPLSFAIAFGGSNGPFPNIAFPIPLGPTDRTGLGASHSKEVLSTDIVEATRTVSVWTALALIHASAGQSLADNGEGHTMVMISLQAWQHLILSRLLPSSPSSTGSLYVSTSQPFNSISARGLRV